MPDRANNPSGSVQLEDMIGEETTEKQRLTKSTSSAGEEDATDSSRRSFASTMPPARKERPPSDPPQMSASTPSTLEKNGGLKKGPSFRSLQRAPRSCSSTINTPNHCQATVGECLKEDDGDDGPEVSASDADSDRPVASDE